MFNVTYQFILDSLNGSVASDFSTAGTSGAGVSVIEREIEIAENEIVAGMDPGVQRLLEAGTMPAYLIKAKNVSGVYEFTPNIPIDTSFLEIRTDATASNNRICMTKSCGRSFEDLGLFTDYTETDGTITFGSSYDPDTYNYYISYNIDFDSWNDWEIIGKIRNRVCCILGGLLYTENDQQWGVVEKYCEMAGITKNWIPGAFRKVVWLNTPYASSIMSVGKSRSS